MADKKTYTVHRAMHGDGKDYERGDTREMTETDAAPLVASGALSPEGEEPVTRATGVQHTFGTKPSEINDRGYTSATGEGVTAPRSAPATKPAAKKNA